MFGKPSPKVLLAATVDASKQVTAYLAGLVELVTAHTFDKAVALLCSGERPALVVVGYHFDELRPYRFIQHVKSDPQSADLPVLLIRALPLHLGTDNVETMRDAYTGIGVTDFVSLHDLERDHGHARAAEVFRQTVLTILLRKRA